MSGLAVGVFSGTLNIESEALSGFANNTIWLIVIAFFIAHGFLSTGLGSLTHYGAGPAPVLYGSGYVELSDWWKVGFMMSVVNILIWMIVGALWWKLLGIY